MVALPASTHLGGDRVDPIRSELRPIIEPLVALDTGAIVGSELLLRPTKGSLACWMAGAPSSIRDEIVLWALELASRELRRSRANVHVNVTPGDLKRASFVADVERLVDPDSLSRLVLEVTESEELCPTTSVLRTIADLRAIGVSFAVDDFGEGWANLSSVRILRPAVIKVSWAVVGPGYGLPGLASWIVDLAGALGARTVLERIEDTSSAEWAQAVGFDLGQGFLWPALVPA